jgi:hypothetical protein
LRRTVEPPRLLFSIDQTIARFDVTPDGQRFLILKAPPPDY